MVVVPRARHWRHVASATSVIAMGAIRHGACTIRARMAGVAAMAASLSAAGHVVASGDRRRVAVHRHAHVASHRHAASSQWWIGSMASLWVRSGVSTPRPLRRLEAASVALPCPALPCLAVPCLALPCLALPCLALPCLAVASEDRSLTILKHMDMDMDMDRASPYRRRHDTIYGRRHDGRRAHAVARLRRGGAASTAPLGVSALAPAPTRCARLLM